MTDKRRTYIGPDAMKPREATAERRAEIEAEQANEAALDYDLNTPEEAKQALRPAQVLFAILAAMAAFSLNGALQIYRAYQSEPMARSIWEAQGVTEGMLLFGVGYEFGNLVVGAAVAVLLWVRPSIAVGIGATIWGVILIGVQFYEFTLDNNLFGLLFGALYPLGLTGAGLLAMAGAHAKAKLDRGETV